MIDRPIEQLTLRELFTNTEWLMRELSEHLEQSYAPRARSAQESVRSFDRAEERSEIPDATIRAGMSLLLRSDEFSQQLFTRLGDHLTAIEKKSELALHSP
ncbi:MAG: hypothetical protein ACKV0T_14630 [Planctomycetales bacterium]